MLYGRFEGRSGSGDLFKPEEGTQDEPARGQSNLQTRHRWERARPQPAERTEDLAAGKAMSIKSCNQSKR